MFDPGRNLPRWVVWPGLVLIFFGAIGPTLSWLEFSGGMENLNVATALELRRDHATILPHGGDPADSWMVPTLEGESRVKKPPLTAWITAAAIRPSTVEAMSDRNPTLRRAADGRLAWEVRWPSLLAACLMLIATYELGRATADPATGLAAALICGTTMLFLRFARSAMIDVHLGLWVTIADVGLAHALLHGRRWFGCLLAGGALGFGFLTKGPVGWIEALVPVLVFAAILPLIGAQYRRYQARRQVARGFPLDPPPPRGISQSTQTVFAPAPQRRWLAWIAPIAIGLLLMLAIALPWYIYIIRSVPGGLDIWLGEVTSERGEKPSSFHQYLLIFVYILPWTVFFIAGMINARRGLALALCFALVPLLVLSFYKDRKERYMFPMTAPCAVVAAAGVMGLARKRDPWNNWDRAAVAQHWALLVILGVVLPAIAATTWTPWLVTITKEPWLARSTGAGLTLLSGIIIAAGMLLRRHWAAAMLGTTLLVTLAIHAALIPGYARTEQGESPMRPLANAIWQKYPDAQMFNAHPKGKRASVDLSIYMNRITQWVSMEELTAMQPGPKTRVVVMLQDAKDTAPPKPPAGWQYVAKVPRDKDWWWAFALPAAAR